MTELDVRYGDARRLPIADKSVHAIVCSPPYFGLRAYGDDDAEIGRQSLAEYLEDMKCVAAEAWRVLDEEGLWWMNIGDTAAGSGGAGGDYNIGGSKAGKRRWRQGETGLASKQWCNVPARVSVALQEQGWLLRSTVVWDKGGMRPESLNHVKRPGVSHEYILLLAKGPKHRFYPERLTEKGSVWHFHSSRSQKDHPATFPLELPERAILCSTEPGDTVLDQFAGAGTTIQAAFATGRVGIGFDLYPPAQAA